MLISAIMLVIKIPIMLILGLLPRLSFELPSGIFNSLDALMYGVGYILPLKALCPILTISLGISLFRIVWALILRIKSFIPTMSN